MEVIVLVLVWELILHTGCEMKCKKKMDVDERRT